METAQTPAITPTGTGVSGKMYSLAGLGLLTVTPVWLVQPIAQAADYPTATPASGSLNQTRRQPTAEAYTLFVNPTEGNDQLGKGSQQQPLKTITRALQIAQPNTVIVLAPGVYSAENGESFPIRLKPGVTLQGDPHLKGENTLIQGGGLFISPTFARQNVAVLGANGAAITGITISNPNPRGYGLWLESTSPVVADNTFTGNSHDGISITGNSTAVIQRNTFYQNRANGITVYGTARPEIRENLFQSTGFGINIAQNAAPLVANNRIISNVDGVVVQANARPVLRQNSIESNRRDGVVAISNARPDLGMAGEPGSNVFRNNGRLDVNAVSSQRVPAFGNQLASNRVTRQVDLTGTTIVVETPASEPRNAPVATPAVNGGTRRGAVIPSSNNSNPPAARPAAQPAAIGGISAAAFPVPTTLDQSRRLPDRPTPAASPVVARGGMGNSIEAAAAVPIPVPAPERNSVVPFPTAPRSLSTPAAPQQLDRTVRVTPTPGASRRTPTATPVASRTPASSSRKLPTPPAQTRATSVAVNSGKTTPAAANSGRPTPVTANSGRSTPVAVNSGRSTSLEIPVPAPESNTLAPIPGQASRSVPPTRPAPATNRPITPAKNQPTTVAVATPPRGVATPEVLPVPNAAIPLGDSGDLPDVVVVASSQGVGSPPVPPSRRTVVGLRYRVVVVAGDEMERIQVRSLIPSAFQTQSGGRPVMQVGAFVDRNNADQMQQMLASRGLQAMVEQLN